MTNWRKEAERFAPRLRVLVHHGPDRANAKAFAGAAAEADLVVTTYATLVRDVETLRRVGWTTVVLDEAQNVKNHLAAQSQAARSLDAKWRVAATGTPVENRLTELWSISHFLNPGYLGGLADFRDNYATPIERWADEQAQARLSRLVRPVMLRRLKSDPAIAPDLPAKIETTTYVQLSREQATLYQSVVRDAVERIDGLVGIQRAAVVLQTLTRLKQVCNHPAHFLADHSRIEGRSAKLERLEAMLEEALQEGDRVLVFTQFREMGEILQAYLAKRFGAVAFLHGGTPRTARDAMVARFQGREGPRIFLLSLRAGGTGLNLTAANRVFHFDRWWNPAVEDQATDRAHRIGQKSKVQVHKFVCQGTLEERIDEALQQKRDLARRVVGSGEEWITKLSTRQLNELLQLRPGAVGE